MNTAELIIIGGGQAGLATAHHALAMGLHPLILDASTGPGGSWPNYYESLKLFSPARYSALPGTPFPGDPDRYPSRDEAAAYLATYARDLDAEIRHNERVQTLATNDEGFAVETANGATFMTEKIIVATGGFGKPFIPTLPGLHEFTGQILHSADYLRPDDVAGDRVIVVGGGNSAVQIAVELAATATVSLATRRSLRWQAQRILGQDFHWWLDRSGLDRSRAGLLLTQRGTPVVDDGRYRAAVRAGRPDRRHMFTHITNDGVIWADGSHEHVDTIVLATGFVPDTPFLPAEAVDPAGFPHHSRGVSTTIPGLGYVGMEHQRTFASATLRGVGNDAEHVLDAIGSTYAPVPHVVR
ncbi:NAD(P)/FAD-dependent oxidoreductase [Paenarthrobacter sp. CC6]|uniref:flavin-containing monooxygenase n=1 Tax=Paenarthrobacter sp. CC6 TaxID=3029184 RepID=UPI00339BDCD8